jgi:2-methylcitrate dehydratase PrpD
MTAVSEFSAELRYDDIPEPMLAVLRRSFLDTMGVAAIGQSTEMSAITRRTARAVFGAGGAGGARMLMDGGLVSPVGAAMAGAFTIDSIDAHDGTTPNKGHVGSAVFPAVLAVADTLVQAGRPVSGQDLAVWLAIGYEVASRAGQVQHATCADYHTSGSWNAVGVGAAVMRMLGGTAD